MNFQTANKLLKKINKLYEGLDGEASEIEKDLLKSYIRHFYEAVLEEEDTPEPVAKAAPKKRKAAAKKATPKVVEPPEEEEEEEEVVVAAKPAPPRKKAAPKAAASSKKFSPELTALFEESEVTDIAEKLSNLPVKQLSKSMGVNERILSINELFGGDGDSFRTTLKELDTLDSYDAAKAYLANGVAKKHDWASDGNFKKALIFVKLVKRRYL